MTEDRRIDKHEQILEKLIEQGIRQDELLKAIIQRTVDHAEEIKQIREKEVDVGRILERLKLKSDIIQWILVTVVAAIIAYLVPHIIR